MPKIKLVIVRESYSYSYDDYNHVLSRGISDWEEVSDEELQFIECYKHLIPVQQDERVEVVKQLDSDVPETITNIKNTLAALKQAEEDRKAAEKARKEQLAIAREARKLEKDRKSLKKLLESNPDLVKEVLSDG